MNIPYSLGAWGILASIMSSISLSCAETHGANFSPEIRIIYPGSESGLFTGLYTKIKTEAFDRDGSIAEVRFYINDIFLGAVTQPPFSYVRYLTTADRGELKIIARDDTGAETQATQRLIISEAPVGSIATLGPPPGTLVPAGANVELSADVVATGSRGFRNPVMFFLNGQSVGGSDAGPINATNPPVSFTLTNLVEGLHEIAVGLLTDCLCPSSLLKNRHFRAR